MMKKILFVFKSQLSLLVIMLVVFSVAGLAEAGVWKPAPANPPSNNAETPINVGATAQIKTGSLLLRPSNDNSTSLYASAKSYLLNLTAIKLRIGLENESIDPLSGTFSYNSTDNSLVIYGGKAKSSSGPYLIKMRDLLEVDTINARNINICNEQGSCSPIGSGGLPEGTLRQTLVYGSDGWSASSLLTNNGTNLMVRGEGALEFGASMAKKQADTGRIFYRNLTGGLQDLFIVGGRGDNPIQTRNQVTISGNLDVTGGKISLNQENILEFGGGIQGRQLNFLENPAGSLKYQAGVNHKLVITGGLKSNQNTDPLVEIRESLYVRNSIITRNLIADNLCVKGLEGVCISITEIINNINNNEGDSDLPTGVNNDTLRHDGTNWVTNPNFKILSNGNVRINGLNHHINGNLGIGFINTPNLDNNLNVKLHVNGNIRAEGFCLGTNCISDWSDLDLANNLTDGTTENQTLRWDNTTNRWMANDVLNINSNTGIVSVNPVSGQSIATLQVVNPGSNSNSIAQVMASNNSSNPMPSGIRLIALGENYSDSNDPAFTADTGVLRVGGNLSGGLNISSGGGYSNIKFFSGVTETVRFQNKQGEGVRVGINNNNPQATLDVGGNIKISGGNPGLDKILTSDAIGKAEWRDLPSLVTSVIPNGTNPYETLYWNGSKWTRNNVFLIKNDVLPGVVRSIQSLIPLIADAGILSSSVNTNAIKLPINAGLNKVLTSDETGNASWKSLSDLGLLNNTSEGVSYQGSNTITILPNNILAVANSGIGAGQMAQNSIATGNIINRTIQGVDINQMNASTGQVLKWNGSTWAPGTDNAGIGEGTGTTYTGLNGITVNDSVISLPSGTTGQVLKWTGSTWAPGTDEVGSGNLGVGGIPNPVLTDIILNNSTSDSPDIRFASTGFPEQRIDTRNGDLRFYNSEGKIRMSIEQGGNVRIGQGSNVSNLSVNGTIVGGGLVLGALSEGSFSDKILVVNESGLVSKRSATNTYYCEFSGNQIPLETGAGSAISGVDRCGIRTETPSGNINYIISCPTNYPKIVSGGAWADSPKFLRESRPASVSAWKVSARILNVITGTTNRTSIDGASIVCSQ